MRHTRDKDDGDIMVMLYHFIALKCRLLHITGVRFILFSAARLALLFLPLFSYLYYTITLVFFQILSGADR